MNPALLNDEIEWKMDNHKLSVKLLSKLTLNNIKKIASTGVDRVSIGMLTQSVSAIDVKLEI